MKKDPVEIFKDSLYAYDDYRVFLKDYFALRKKIRATFTQRYFAKHYGFGSHAFCNFVINGKRNLSSKTLVKFINALELDSAKAYYFENLVFFNQTSEVDEKDRYFEEMQRIRKRVNFQSVQSKQSNYYAKWYYPVVRELAVHADWQNRFDVLASLVYPSITEKEAEEAITIMIDIGILVVKDGEYFFKHENLDDSAIPAYIKKRARRDTFKAGLDALEAFSPKERYASFATFTADESTFDEINSLFEDFLNRATDKISDVSKGKKVFQMTYELFPVSKDFDK